MINLVGKPAPVFEANAAMPEDTISSVSLSDFLHRKYVILFFYPLDFTFVCPTELLAVNNRISQLEDMDVKVLGISVDSEHTHMAWRRTSLDQGGIGQIQFPLIADLTKNISMDYGVLHDGGIAYRATFLIDKSGIIRHQSVNDLPIGRNIDEVARIIDALRHYEEYGEVCPAGWEKGKSAMQPTFAGVSHYLTSHSEEL